MGSMTDMIRHLLISISIFGLLLSACNSGKDEPIKGGCGLDAYDWLPAEQVGQILSLVEDESNRMSSTTIDAMLQLAGQDHLTPLPYGARLYRIRYTTQDKGRSVEASGMLAIPWNDGEKARRFPVILMLHGTSGFMGECAPSYQTEKGHELVLILFAALGFVAVGPDYIGLDAGADFTKPPPVKHAYLGMEQTALGSLDMLRAAETLLADQLDEFAEPNYQVLLWGASQGGHAVFACDLFAPVYAPEFEVQGAVALVPGTDLLALSQYALSETNEASIGVAGALTAHYYWYESEVGLDNILTDEDPWYFASRLPDAMYTGCDGASQFEGVTTIEEVYQADIIDKVANAKWDELEPWSCYLRENSVAHTSVKRINQTPIFFITSENDLLAHTPTERADYERMCGLGYQLQYLECSEAGHTDSAWWSLPEQLAWLDDRLNGLPLDQNKICNLEAAQRCSAQPEE
jgi:secretory lipase